MAYRDDHDAALREIDALRCEVGRLSSENAELREARRREFAAAFWNTADRVWQDALGFFAAAAMFAAFMLTVILLSVGLATLMVAVGWAK
jgi:ferric-dicitrate binding protein FerR (iron transport regulator)